MGRAIRIEEMNSPAAEDIVTVAKEAGTVRSVRMMIIIMAPVLPAEAADRLIFCLRGAKLYRQPEGKAVMHLINAVMEAALPEAVRAEEAMY